MKNRYSILLFLFVTLIAACGKGKTDNNLAAKQKKLEKLETQSDALDKEIKTLKEEIAKLDTANKELNTKFVAVDTLAGSNFSSQTQVMGKIDVDANSVVSASMGGTVKSIYVTEGKYVKQGTTLARIDNDVMNQNIAQIKQQLGFASQIYEKQKKLWDQKIGSEVQYLSAKNNKEALEANLRTMYQSNELYKIKAPFSGVVDQVALKIGQTIAPGMPAFRIVSNEGVTFKAEIPESYISKIKKNSDVTVHFPDIDKDIKGKVKYLSQVINPLNRTFTAEVTLTGDKTLVKSDMVGVLSINDYAKSNTIAIPVKTLLKNLDGYYVYLAKMKDGHLTVVPAPIKIGVVSTDKVEVLSGLEKGDLLITSGSQNINEGDLLQINND